MWQKAGIKYQELCPKNPGQTSGDDLRYATNSEGHVTITRNEGEKGDVYDFMPWSLHLQTRGIRMP